VTILPVTLVIATLERRERLLQTLRSVLAQEDVPTEWIIIDASARPVTTSDLPELPSGVVAHCRAAEVRGAAAQRNQGFALSTQAHILWLDDDVDLQPGCLRELWLCLQADPTIGGCSAHVINATYHHPGPGHRHLLGLLGCPKDGSLAGQCCGPALNFLPAHTTNHVDWLNLGCALYRRAALPQPPFLPLFHGYSLMEDVALSLEVGRRWKLGCPSTSRILHDPRPAPYKDDTFSRERMEVINRSFVMRVVLGRRGLRWAARQAAYQGLMLLLSLRTAVGWKRLPFAMAGKASGLMTVVRHQNSWTGYSSRPA
jgi:GT2 family glycosyltransferase